MFVGESDGRCQVRRLRVREDTLSGGVQVRRLRVREDTPLGMCLWERVPGGVSGLRLRVREDTVLGHLFVGESEGRCIQVRRLILERIQFSECVCGGE